MLTERLHRLEAGTEALSTVPMHMTELIAYQTAVLMRFGVIAACAWPNYDFGFLFPSGAWLCLSLVLSTSSPECSHTEDPV